MEVSSRVLVRDNEVTARWVLAHHGIVGSKKADEYAGAAAEGSAPQDGVPDGHQWEASLSHMTRSHATALYSPLYFPLFFPMLNPAFSFVRRIGEQETGVP